MSAGIRSPPDKPSPRELDRDAIFPLSVRGPVERRQLRRLAADWRSVVMSGFLEGVRPRGSGITRDGRAVSSAAQPPTLYYALINEQGQGDTREIGRLSSIFWILY